MNVYIVGVDGLIESMFRERGWNIVNNMEDADLVQFTGGSDVDPHYYGEEYHHTTFSSPGRDLEEKKEFIKAMYLCKSMAGICRG